MSYTNLLTETNKQNRYDFGNYLMPEEEYEQLYKNYMYNKPTSTPPHLKLLDDSLE
jgi:hypothetical protein